MVLMEREYVIESDYFNDEELKLLKILKSPEFLKLFMKVAAYIGGEICFSASPKLVKNVSILNLHCGDQNIMMFYVLF